MSRDLIERLRSYRIGSVVFESGFRGEEPQPLMLEAADRITVLEAEASEDARLLGQAGEKIANLSGEIDRLKRDLARAEAEASEGERRGLERAAAYVEWLTSSERDGSEPPVNRIDDAFNALYRQDMQVRNEAQGRAIAIEVRALIPEAPAREGK